MKFTNVKRIFILCMIAIMSFTVAACSQGSEKEYPSKSIQIIVPFGPGGSTDLSARALASVLPNYLDQPAVVINKPGAGGSVAMLELLDTDPDGYTIMMDAIGSRA